MFIIVFLKEKLNIRYALCVRTTPPDVNRPKCVGKYINTPLPLSNTHTHTHIYIYRKLAIMSRY